MIISSDSNSYLNVLIDGKKTSSTVKRFLREDVDKLISPKYGGNTVTPQAGFQANVNISNLDKGMHKINVQEISRYGELIVETEKNIIIENKKYSR